MTPRVRQYAQEEAMRAGVLMSDILGRSRRRAVAAARATVMRRLCADGFSQSQVARWLGRDASTVNHAVRQDEIATVNAMRVVLPQVSSDAERKSAIMHMRQVGKISDATCAELIHEFGLEAA